MMGFGQQDPRFPELLAAYADGELDAAARAQVETWLAANPDARSSLETQRRLSRHNRKFWRATSASNPGEADWTRVLGNVQDALDAPPMAAPAAPPQRRWQMRYLVPAFSAAIAVALYFAIPSSGPAPIESPVPAGANDSLVLALDADIDIVSIDERDALAILIGRRPLTGAVVLAAVGDVELRSVQKGDNGMMPKVQMNDAGLAPMIIAPITGR